MILDFLLSISKLQTLFWESHELLVEMRFAESPPDSAAPFFRFSAAFVTTPSGMAMSPCGLVYPYWVKRDGLVPKRICR